MKFIVKILREGRSKCVSCNSGRPELSTTEKERIVVWKVVASGQMTD